MCIFADVRGSRLFNYLGSWDGQFMRVLGREEMEMNRLQVKPPRWSVWFGLSPCMGVSI